MTPVEVKQAIVELLYNQLNTDEDDPVSVFYGRKEADFTQPAVIVGDCQTSYDASRMSARSTLRRYDLTYAIYIELIPGLRFRTQYDAEAECYRLLDRELTPLVRGDARGVSLLENTVPGLQQVVPLDDTMVVAYDDDRDPQFPVLVLRLGISLIRD